MKEYITKEWLDTNKIPYKVLNDKITIFYDRYREPILYSDFDREHAGIDARIVGHAFIDNDQGVYGVDINEILTSTRPDSVDTLKNDLIYLKNQNKLRTLKGFTRGWNKFLKQNGRAPLRYRKNKFIEM